MRQCEFAMTKQPRETADLDLAWKPDHAKRRTLNSRGTKVHREIEKCSYAWKNSLFTGHFKKAQSREKGQCEFAMIKRPRETTDLDLAWKPDHAKRRTSNSRGMKVHREIEKCSYAWKNRLFTGLFKKAQSREKGQREFAMTKRPRELTDLDLAWSVNPAKRRTLNSR